MINVLQINLNRCREAHDLLAYTVGEHQIDLCLLSEPNQARARGTPGWVTDDGQDTAIVNEGRAPIRDKGKGPGFTWVHVHGVGIFYRCYFSPNKGTEAFENFLGG